MGESCNGSSRTTGFGLGVGKETGKEGIQRFPVLPSVQHLPCRSGFAGLD